LITTLYFVIENNNMMFDSNKSAGNGSLGNDESHHLATHDSFFNDLEYSDDDEPDEYWDTAELGFSSPDTAALLDDIQNAIFPIQQQQSTAQQQQQQQQSHLMHPLARQSSVQSSDYDEDRSYLAYSITSSHADEESNKAASLGASPTQNYGSLDAYFKPQTTAAVTFRPPSSVFDHSSRSNSRQPNRPYSQQKSPSLKPKPSRMENSLPNQSSQNGRQSSTNGGNHNIHNGYPPTTPFPSMASESPVTSATATDETHSPINGIEPNDDTYTAKDEEQHGEKERITKLLSAEATKRLRRHRRLKRIKKVAEAREAAVKKVRGVEQPPGRCNDAIFAFIFLCQFLLVSMSAMAFGPGALRDKIYGSLNGGDDGDAEEGDNVDYNPFAGLQTDDVIIVNNPGQGIAGWDRRGGIPEGEMSDGISHIDYINIFQLVCIASGYASLCSLLALWFMMMLSKNLLHATLIFTIGASLLWTILGLAFGSYYILPLTGVIAMAVSFFYTLVVWDRISFAATNLSVALKGMRSTLDIPFVGVCVLAITILWTIWWVCAFVGTFDFLNDDTELSNDWMSVVVVFFIFSYYWTFQVIKGISQTTVASIIGKWWEMSEEDALPICSSVLHTTISRNIVGSFGSICLGSLIIGPCILLTRISTFSRLAKPKLNKWRKKSKVPGVESEDGKYDAGCIPNASCSQHTNDSVISRNVNQWSFTYIGLYGYKFWDSGSKASQLFEARGWTHVVSDDLIMTVMAMSSMIIGGSTACLGLIVEEVDGYSFTSLNKPITTAFFIGLFVGFFLSSAFLSIIEGSVSAILVCYASAPVEFHANHHKLSEEMKSAWKHFWLQKPNNAR